MTDREKLLGAWRLISWEQKAGQGVTYPLGSDAIGQMYYEGSGRMSAQLAGVNPKQFASEDWNSATPEEKTGAWGNYFGYFGTYTIDETRKVVTRRIDGSWFPNLVGSVQERAYRFDGKQLVLEASMPWGEVRIIWEKYYPPEESRDQ
jgi:Lipocalin-like domain